MSRRRWAGSRVRSARAHWAARLPLPCALGCGGVVDGRTPWVVEHLVPRSMGGSDHVSNQGVSHRSCSDKQGGQLAARITNAPRQRQREESARARGIRGI